MRDMSYKYHTDEKGYVNILSFRRKFRYWILAWLWKQVWKRRGLKHAKIIRIYKDVWVLVVARTEAGLLVEKYSMWDEISEESHREYGEL